MADDSRSLGGVTQPEAIRAERDAALGALERSEREAEEQLRLLVEEQDRFVSRLLESHEREVGKLRLELEEARMAAARYEHKLQRDRATNERLEDQLAVAQVELTRLREQRDSARMETRRSQQAYVTSQAAVDALKSELDLARALAAPNTERSVRTSAVRPPPLPPRPSRLAAGSREPAVLQRDSSPPSSR